MKLYNYFRSYAAYRVRIALNLKGITWEHVGVHLLKREHRSADYLALNPVGLVPSLVTDDGAVIAQSLAIIEYLDETHCSDKAEYIPGAKVYRGWDFGLTPACVQHDSEPWIRATLGGVTFLGDAVAV